MYQNKYKIGLQREQTFQKINLYVMTSVAGYVTIVQLHAEELTASYTYVLTYLVPSLYFLSIFWFFNLSNPPYKKNINTFLLVYFPYLYANIWDGKQAMIESIPILTDRKIFFDFSDT